MFDVLHQQNKTNKQTSNKNNKRSKANCPLKEYKNDISIFVRPSDS